MKTITQYRQEIKDLTNKVGDLDAAAISASRDLTGEEIDLKNDILDKIEDVEKMVLAMERQEEITSRLDAPLPRKTAVKDGSKYEVGVDNRTKDKFASFGSQMAAVMVAGTRGGAVDPRLYNAASGLNETTPSDGGFLVQTEYSDSILKNVWDSGMILPKVSKITLSGNKNSMELNGLDETSRVNGSRAGGIAVYTAAEAAAVTASRPKFRQISLKLNKLMGICYATDELLEDTNALAQTITEGFRDEFDFKLTDHIINGTGAGEALGILNSGCVVSVGKENGQAAGTIVFENINNMWSRLMAKSRPNAVWIINQDCEPQLNQMSIAVGTGGVPVYMPAGGVSVSPYGTLFGRPVVPIEQCQTVGTTGDIMLCDFSQYKAIDKGGLKGDVSVHVQFLVDESTFKFTYRFDGQPLLGSPITPFKGTSTLSHFIKLDTRA